MAKVTPLSLLERHFDLASLPSAVDNTLLSFGGGFKFALLITPIENSQSEDDGQSSSTVNSQNALNWSIGVSHSTVPTLEDAPSAHNLLFVIDIFDEQYFLSNPTHCSEEEEEEVVAEEEECPFRKSQQFPMLMLVDLSTDNAINVNFFLPSTQLANQLFLLIVIFESTL